MKIKKASLIGHSMAGGEMTLFTTVYPERVKKLVYLDAAYDDTVGAQRAPNAPDIPPLPKRLILEVLGSSEAENIVVKSMPPPDVWERMKATMRRFRSRSARVV